MDGSSVRGKRRPAWGHWHFCHLRGTQFQPSIMKWWNLSASFLTRNDWCSTSRIAAPQSSLIWEMVSYLMELERTRGCPSLWMSAQTKESDNRYTRFEDVPLPKKSASSASSKLACVYHFHLDPHLLIIIIWAQPLFTVFLNLGFCLLLLLCGGEKAVCPRAAMIMLLSIITVRLRWAALSQFAAC